jgi:hypothetical protein
MPRGEPTYVFCDNESVVKHTTNVESTLNKKHSSVAYHHCRWSVAAVIITIAHIRRHENLADCFTKGLPVNTRNYVFGNQLKCVSNSAPPLGTVFVGPSKCGCEKYSCDAEDCKFCWSHITIGLVLPISEVPVEV